MQFLRKLEENVEKYWKRLIIWKIPRSIIPLIITWLMWFFISVYKSHNILIRCYKDVNYLACDIFFQSKTSRETLCYVITMILVIIGFLHFILYIFCAVLHYFEGIFCPCNFKFLPEIFQVSFDLSIFPPLL